MLKTTTVKAVGDMIPNDYGRDVVFSGFDGDSIIFGDNFSVPAKPGFYHIGNHNYLEIIEVDIEQGMIRAKVRSRLTAGWLRGSGF